MFTGKYLSSIKKKAMRKGVWYSTLDRVERGIISLTVHILDKVESEILGVELVKILVKLVKASKSEFVRRIEEYGWGKANDLADFAVEWGNISAKKWAENAGFAMYLTLIDLTQPSEFGV